MVINDLLELPFAVKAGTQDYHPPNHISFATQHAPPDNEPFSWTRSSHPSNPAHTAPLLLCPEHCIRGTPGSEIIPEINTSNLDVIVRKGQDHRTEMFSGFMDSFGRRVLDGHDVADLDLGNYLTEREVTDVFVCGLTGDCCVKSTALDAAKLGFNSFVIEDAAKSFGEDQAAAAKRELLGNKVRVVQANDVKMAIVDWANSGQSHHA